MKFDKFGAISKSDHKKENDRAKLLPEFVRYQTKQITSVIDPTITAKSLSQWTCGQ